MIAFQKDPRLRGGEGTEGLGPEAGKVGVMHARDAESGARAGAAGSTRDGHETRLLQNCANRQLSVYVVSLN